MAGLVMLKPSEAVLRRRPERHSLGTTIGGGTVMSRNNNKNSTDNCICPSSLKTEANLDIRVLQRSRVNDPSQGKFHLSLLRNPSS